MGGWIDRGTCTDDSFVIILIGVCKEYKTSQAKQITYSYFNLFHPWFGFSSWFLFALFNSSFCVTTGVPQGFALGSFSPHTQFHFC